MSRSITHSFLIAIALFIVTSSASAQVQDTNFRRFSLGPHFLAGASVFSGEVPHTWKTELKFAWSAGVISTFATSPKFAMNLGLALDSRRIFFHQEDAKAITTQMAVSTFDIYAGAKFNDFIIGFNFGFPMNAEMTLNDGTGRTVVASEDHFSTDDLATKVEICLGALFNIVESETGKFQFMLKAMYPLTQMWDKTPYSMRKLHPVGSGYPNDIEVQANPLPGDNNSRQFENGVIPSLQFGFVYQFNLGGKY